MPKERKIRFSKIADNAMTSLLSTERSRAKQLLDMIAINISDPLLSGKIIKLLSLDQKLFAVRLNSKLRIVVELTPDELYVHDILNQDLFYRYFKGRTE